MCLMKREAKQSETSAFRAEKGFIARAMQGDAWLLPLSPSGSLKGFSKAFIKKKKTFIYLILAVLVLVAAWAFSLVAVHGLLTAVVSLVTEHRL